MAHTARIISTGGVVFGTPVGAEAPTRWAVQVGRNTIYRCRNYKEAKDLAADININGLKAARRHR